MGMSGHLANHSCNMLYANVKIITPLGNLASMKRFLIACRILNSSTGKATRYPFAYIEGWGSEG